MRATSVACRHSDLLDAVLATTCARGHLSSGRAVSRLGNGRGAQANLRGTADDGTGCYESFWCGLVSGRIDVLFLDDRGLITGAHVGFLAAYAASRVRSHVFDLSDVVVASFDIVQNDATLVRLSLSSLAHEGWLSDKSSVRRREVLILHQLAHAAVVLVSNLLLDARAATSLPTNRNDLVWLRSQSNFMNFINMIGGGRWMGSGAL